MKFIDQCTFILPFELPSMDALNTVKRTNYHGWKTLTHDIFTKIRQEIREWKVPKAGSPVYVYMDFYIYSEDRMSVIRDQDAYSSSGDLILAALNIEGICGSDCDFNVAEDFRVVRSGLFRSGVEVHLYSSRDKYLAEKLKSEQEDPCNREEGMTESMPKIDEPSVTKQEEEMAKSEPKVIEKIEKEEQGNREEEMAESMPKIDKPKAKEKDPLLEELWGFAKRNFISFYTIDKMIGQANGVSYLWFNRSGRISNDKRMLVEALVKYYDREKYGLGYIGGAFLDDMLKKSGIDPSKMQSDFIYGVRCMKNWDSLEANERHHAFELASVVWRDILQKLEAKPEPSEEIKAETKKETKKTKKCSFLSYDISESCVHLSVRTSGKVLDISVPIGKDRTNKELFDLFNDLEEFKRDFNTEFGE